jgi:hypothetical protein
MNNAKYTPGPWTLQRSKGPHEITLKRDHYRIGEINSPYRGVAIVFSPEPKEVTDANARLIAAAPELLAALEDAVSDLAVLVTLVEDQDDVRGMFPETLASAKRSVDRGNAIIAMAKGGQR